MEKVEMITTGKKWYESKTLWFNVVTMSLQVLNLLLASVQDPKMIAPLVLLQGVGNIILRIWFTSSPVGEKREMVEGEFRIS